MNYLKYKTNLKDWEEFERERVLNLFLEHEYNLKKIYEGLSKLKHLKVFSYDDIGKIIIFTGFSSISSTDLAVILREKFNIEIEMISKDYILAMSTVCDSKENLIALQNALINIDNDLTKSEYNKQIIIYCFSTM